MTELSTDRRRLLQTAGAGLVGGGLLSAGVSARAADRERWAFETGAPIHSSPTVVDGTVYVGSGDGSLYAVDAASGERAWEFETGDVVNSSPAVADGTVYVGSDDDFLYAVDADTGRRRWKFETGSASYRSPTVADGTVYVGFFGGPLYALNAATGERETVFETRDRFRSSPVAVDDIVYVGTDDGVLYALNASTSQPRWEFETGEAIFSSPTVADGTVYAGSLDGHLYAVETATGEQRWAFEIGTWIDSSPTVADGTVYVGAEDNSLYALDAASGALQWEFETGDEIDSSPTVAGGTVYVGSVDDSLYAVDAATGEQRWAFETGDYIVSSPTVVDGTVYVGSEDGSLYALEADTDASSDGSRVRQQVLGHHDRVLDRAVFDYSPSVPSTDEPIAFDGSNTHGVIETYTWEFGDHTTATGETATHTYDEAGEYDVTLTVRGADGEEESTTKTIPVGQPTGTLSVSPTPSDARVIVDDELLETAAVERPVGQYAVTAVHDEYESETESVTVEAGETTAVAIDLTADDSFRIDGYEPQDSTGDGLYNDFDGDGETTHDDVSAFFEHLEADAVQNNPEKFDFDGNDRLGFADVIDLLRRV